MPRGAALEKAKRPKKKKRLGQEFFRQSKKGGGIILEFITRRKFSFLILSMRRWMLAESIIVVISQHM